MTKLKILIERTKGGHPALKEVLQHSKFLIVCNQDGQRKAKTKRGNLLVRIEPKDLIIVAINCNTYFSISIYKILEILESENLMHVIEINKLKDGVWQDILPQQQEIEKTLTITMNLINGRKC